MVTMDIGAFTAKETVWYCPLDRITFKAESLRNIVPERGTYGFDVIVEVGQALFVHCRNSQETMDLLAAKNIFMSEREISYLGRKFIIYLALAHRESQSHLRFFMAQNGGYILHVDGTCEGDSPNLFCGIDGISELVLDAIKIPSEKKERLVPFFQRIKNQYGTPKALVHDMGRGIIAAVEEVFPGIPDFICHFHFLRDIGKDLLLEEYTAFHKRLSKLKVRPSLRRKAKHLEQKIDPITQPIDEIIVSMESGEWGDTSLEHIPLITTYALIHWVFDYTAESNGYGFPFDRPHLDFYRRLQKAHRLLEDIRDIHLCGSKKDNKPFFHIWRAYKMIVDDKRLNDLAKSLERKADVFDRLRKAMRITLPEDKMGLNDNGTHVDIRTIEAKVTSFRDWLTSKTQRQGTYAGMIKQLDKYWEKLFADPLKVTTATSDIQYIQPQRTNNILERFFRGEKRRGRKKTGMASLNKMLKSILADTPLVQNLKNDAYIDIILNGCSCLAERFSQIDTGLVQKEIQNAKCNSESIFPGIKMMVRDSDLLIKIESLFTSYAT